MRLWAIRAAVSVGVAIFLLTIIPVHAVLDALRRVSVWTWAGALGIFVGGHYLNALKLRLLVGRNAVSRSSCLRAQYAGLAANLGLPGIAGGDIVRAAYLAPTAGAARVALASIVDRLIDTLTLVLLVAVALPIAGVPPTIAGMVWRGSGWLLAAGAAAGAVTAVAIVLRKHERVSAWLAAPLAELRTRRSAFVKAAAISCAVQSAFVLINARLASQVGVTAGLAAWFIAWPLSKLIAILPLSLGGIGVREAALVSLLAPYGAPRELVLATGILWQAVLTVSGLAGFLVTHVGGRPALAAAPVTSSVVDAPCP